MTPPTNGITAEVIREIMPPYHLSRDLLEATVLTLPPPPADAATSWREARLTRLIAEITAYLPADAAQARIAAQILTVRELADTLATRAYAPELTVAEVCRLGRASDSLVQTATGLERALARHQKLPVPFFGTVVQDEVDIGALDAVWCQKPLQQSAAPGPADAPDPTERRPGVEAVPDDAVPAPVGEAASAAGDEADAPEPAPSQPDAAPPAADAEPLPVMTTAVPIRFGRDRADGLPRQFGSVDAAPHIPAAAVSAATALGSGTPGSGAAVEANP
jgi:hypothetical protein